MNQNRATNLLLAVIACCLVLITARMYGVSPIADAQAQSMQGMLMFGCQDGGYSSNCTKIPIAVDEKGRVYSRK